jgi:hypothetical protein
VLEDPGVGAAAEGSRDDDLHGAVAIEIGDREAAQLRCRALLRPTGLEVAVVVIDRDPTVPMGSGDLGTAVTVDVGNHHPGPGAPHVRSSKLTPVMTAGNPPQLGAGGAGEGVDIVVGADDLGRAVTIQVGDSRRGIPTLGTPARKAATMLPLQGRRLYLRCHRNRQQKQG